MKFRVGLSSLALGRQWRIPELRVLALGVVVAVAAVTSVGFFTDRVQRALSQQASELLGADLVVASPDRPRADLRRAASLEGLDLAQTVSFPSVILHGASTLLTDVKAVSEGYPLRGRLRVATRPFGVPFEVEGIPAPGEIWVDLRVLQQLGMQLGDAVQLGERSFRASRLLTYEPDRGGDLFQLAPRVLLNEADLPSTGLVTPASRVRYRLLLAGSEAAVARFRAALDGALQPGERLQGIRDARPELRAALDRAQQFLGLAAVTAVLLAGAAISVAARHYAERQADASAIMRCLGASGGYVLRVFAIRLSALALWSSLIGCVIGFLAQEVLVLLLAHWFTSTPPAGSLWPVAVGVSTGLVTVMGFAVPYVLGIAQVPPLRVLRRELAAPPPSAWTVLLLACLALGGLLVWVAGDLRLAGWLMLGIALTGLVLWLSAYGLIRVLSVLRGRGSLAWRFGLASLAQRGKLSGVQLAAFGLGIMALLILGIVRVDLLESWQANLPADAPNHFLINVQGEEVAALSGLLAEAGVAVPDFFPMVRGRLTAINDVPVAPDDFTLPRARRLVAREFNLSWAAELQSDNQIVAGHWWGKDAQGKDELSVEAGLAETLGIGLGDRLRFQIAGQELSARVSSLRSVEWDSFRVNFFVVAPPGLLDEYPATYITSFYLAGERGDVLTELIRQFPSVTLLDVEALMRQVRQIMDRATLAIEYVFLFTLAAGLMVLYAAIQASREARQQETAILRTLGANRAQVLLGLFAEFTVLGFLAGLLAATGAAALGYVLADQVFELPYRPNPWIWLAGTLGGAVGIGIAGMMGTRSVLSHPPLQTLQRL